MDRYSKLRILYLEFIGFTVVSCTVLLASGAQSATVPMTIDHARAIIAASFRRPDGAFRNAKLWIDSGNPDWVISEALARDLRLDISGAATKNDLYGMCMLLQ